MSKVRCTFYPGDSIAVLCRVYAGRIGLVQTMEGNIVNIITDWLEGEVRGNSALSCLLS